jgi:hypothetical protein
MFYHNMQKHCEYFFSVDMVRLKIPTHENTTMLLHKKGQCILLSPMHVHYRITNHWNKVNQYIKNDA